MHSGRCTRETACRVAHVLGFGYLPLNLLPILVRHKRPSDPLCPRRDAWCGRATPPPWPRLAGVQSTRAKDSIAPLRDMNGDWKIYDVTVDSISVIANYRNQSNRVINDQGFDNLMADLQCEATGITGLDGVIAELLIFVGEQHARKMPAGNNRWSGLARASAPRCAGVARRRLFGGPDLVNPMGAAAGSAVNLSLRDITLFLVALGQRTLLRCRFNAPMANSSCQAFVVAIGLHGVVHGKFCECFIERWAVAHVSREHGRIR